MILKCFKRSYETLSFGTNSYDELTLCAHAGLDYFCCTRGCFSVLNSRVGDHKKACWISSYQHPRGLKPSPVILKCLRKCHSWFQCCMKRKSFVSVHAFYLVRFSSRRSRKSVLYLVVRTSYKFETFTSHCQVFKGTASVISGLYDPMKPRFWSINQPCIHFRILIDRTVGGKKIIFRFGRGCF